jgi:hypothetical protein
MDPTPSCAPPLWAILLGPLAPWAVALPLGLAVVRYLNRRASREAQARLDAWEATHRPKGAP